MSARLAVLRCLLVGAVSVYASLTVANSASASTVAPAAPRTGRPTGHSDAGVPAMLSTTQLYWARRIIAVVKMYPKFSSEDQRTRAADIALMTALTESGLHMYGNINNPESLRLRHDEIGADHGSVGLFQQQVGGAINSTADWGTTAHCMDVSQSTGSFLDHLTAFDWTSYSNWAAAQKVQGSFDPTGGNYRRNDPLAIATRKMLWADSAAGAAAATPPNRVPNPTLKRPSHGVHEIYRVRRGDNLTHIAARHAGSRVTVASLAKRNQLDNPNLIYAGQLLFIH
jgi:hypothetical protein